MTSIQVFDPAFVAAPVYAEQMSINSWSAFRPM